MIGYVLLEADTADNLIEDVNVKLADGWSLYGSPMVSRKDNMTGMVFCQALTKEEV